MRNAIFFILVFGLFCFAQESQQPQNRTRVQISSTTADNPTLTCSGGTGRQATVTVQVWIIPQPPKGQFLTVGLYGGVSLPPGNRLELDEVRKKVELGDSPAIFQYKLECGRDTTPGDISFTAHIDAAPAGFDVVLPDPPENGIVKLHIK